MEFSNSYSDSYLGSGTYHFVIRFVFTFIVALDFDTNDARLVDEFLDDPAVFPDHFSCMSY